jgi:hypothetical protein
LEEKILAISNAYKKLLNRMNKSACTVALGTALQTAQTNISAIQSASGVPAYCGVTYVTTAQMSASRVTILNASYNNGAMWQYTRGGSPVTTIAGSFIKASGSLNLMNYDVNSGSMKPGDMIAYLLY